MLDWCPWRRTATFNDGADRSDCDNAYTATDTIQTFGVFDLASYGKRYGAQACNSDHILRWP